MSERIETIVQEVELAYCRANPLTPGAPWLLSAFAEWWRDASRTNEDKLLEAVLNFRRVRPVKPFKLSSLYLWIAHHPTHGYEVVPGHGDALRIIPTAYLDLVTVRMAMDTVREIEERTSMSAKLYQFTFDRVVPIDKIAHLRSRNRKGFVDEYFAFIAQPPPLKDDQIAGYFNPAIGKPLAMANSVAEDMHQHAPMMRRMLSLGVGGECRRFVRGREITDLSNPDIVGVEIGPETFDVAS